MDPKMIVFNSNSLITPKKMTLYEHLYVKLKDIEVYK